MFPELNRMFPSLNQTQCVSALQTLRPYLRTLIQSFNLTIKGHSNLTIKGHSILKRGWLELVMSSNLRVRLNETPQLLLY